MTRIQFNLFKSCTLRTKYPTRRGRASQKKSQLSGLLSNFLHRKIFWPAKLPSEPINVQEPSRRVSPTTAPNERAPVPLPGSLQIEHCNNNLNIISYNIEFTMITNLYLLIHFEFEIKLFTIKDL